MSKKKILFIILLIILILGVLGIGFYFLGAHSEQIGSNDLGHVDKTTYNFYGADSPKIIVISGMHSRENLHKSVLPPTCLSFALTHKCQVINYQVTVTSSPDDFNIGRANGESLVHDFVVSDIQKDGGADVTIIGHDHEDGYGEGYYIATPTMDDASLNLADKVCSDIGFNHYKRNSSSTSKSTSISAVDYPILNAGSPVFVYEIPEFDSNRDALSNSYNLLSELYKELTS